MVLARLSCSMTPRPVILLALLVLVALAGCAQAPGLVDGPEASGPGGPADGGPGDTSVFVDDEPEAPETLTAESAAAYVVASEEHHRRVAILQAAEVDVTEIGVSCEATDVVERGDGYEVVVDCGFWYEFQDGDAVGIADGAPYTATYVVDETSIERVGEEPALG